MIMIWLWDLKLHFEHDIGFFFNRFRAFFLKKKKRKWNSTWNIILCSVILLLLFFTSTSVQHGFILNSIHIEHASGRNRNHYENKSIRTFCIYTRYQIPRSETIQLISKWSFLISLHSNKFTAFHFPSDFRNVFAGTVYLFKMYNV